MLSYKIGVVGPSGVGKTCLVRRLVCGEYTREPLPSQKTTAAAHRVLTSRGVREVIFHDYPAGVRGGDGMDAYILLLTGETLSEYPGWRDLGSHGVPVAVALNKYDLINKLLPLEHEQMRSALPFSKGGLYNISGKSYMNFGALMRGVLRCLEGDEKLQLLEELPAVPVLGV